MQPSALFDRGTVARPLFVLRQAQHEDRVFVASPSKINLILSLLIPSLSRDEG